MAGANVDLSSLRIFLAVCEQGTVAGAAGKLALSQPAVSMRIRNLEEQLGLQLLVRGPRGVRPTLAGAVLRESLSDVAGRIEAAVAQAQMAARNVTHRLVFWSPPSLLPYYVAPIFDHLSERHPTVEMAIESGPRPLSDAAPLISGQLDCAILVDAHPRRAVFRSLQAFEDPVGLTLAPNHPLAGLPAVTPADLAGNRLVAYDPHFWQIVKAALSRLPIHLDAALYIRDSQVLKDLVARRYAVTFQPLSAALPEVLAGRLAFRPIAFEDGRLLHMAYWLSFSKRHPLQAVLADIASVVLARSEALVGQIRCALDSSAARFEAR
ncbi:MAG: LysR family transcriptional regulator [Chloroflexota bacterium]|nr:LysR family transcriptional regulator [Chloroflexota bacterium]